MKKAFSIFFTILLVVTFCVPVSAESINDEIVFTTQNGSTFSIIEYETEDHQIVRQFVRTTEDNVSTFSVSTSVEDTVEILLALGFDQDVIDHLPEETLQDYTTSQEITTVTSYIKSDEEGNIEYLSEPEAVAAVQASSYTGATETTTDSYMKVTHTVTYLNNALYLFSTKATWLTMPAYRSSDSVGACAPTFAVENSTRYGWGTCTKTVNDWIYNTTTTTTENLYPLEYKNARDGDWYGSTSIFDLPDDFVSETYSETYTNCVFYYQYKAYIRYPEVETYFNSAGTYSHQRITLVVSPSVSIDTAGTVSASIGLSGATASDDRSAEVLIHYDPDITVLSIGEHLYD